MAKSWKYAYQYSNIKQKRFWNEPNANVNAHNGEFVSKSLEEIN